MKFGCYPIVGKYFIWFLKIIYILMWSEGVEFINSSEMLVVIYIFIAVLSNANDEIWKCHKYICVCIHSMLIYIVYAIALLTQLKATLFVFHVVISVCLYNSLWPSNVIWWHRSGSMLPVATKPLPEPMLTYHQRCSVPLTSEQFYKITWT